VTTRQGLIRSHHRVLALGARIADGAVIALSLWVTTLVTGVGWSWTYAMGAALAVVLFSLGGEVTGMYRSARGTPMKTTAGRTWATWAIVIPWLLLAVFLTRVSLDLSRAVVLVWFLLGPVALTIWRVGLRLLLQEARWRGRNTRSVAIAGLSPNGERLAAEIVATPWSGLRLRGFYDDRDARTGRVHAVAGDWPLLGTFRRLVDDARGGRVDIVYVALPLCAEPRIRRLVRELADTTASVHVVADLFVSDLIKSRWSSVGQVPVLSVFDAPFHGIDGWLKRLEDVVIGSLIMVLIAVPMLLVALAVKVTSRGPVVFKQRRYGLDGREIIVWKFRTMTVCEDGDSVRQVTKGDQRLTAIGAFLRRTSLDELPQFIQVLKGDMSIVGPRPHAIAHNEEYRGKITGYMLRHKVKPGITGWAQVNGWRGETDTLDKMRSRVEHDLEYIRNWGIWLDLKIILLTVFGRKARSNAY
jgi:putative colanic acid biosysnthesis UDP-glucose lipid carrier transferase